jgi:hypothetical protein
MRGSRGVWEKGTVRDGDPSVGPPRQLLQELEEIVLLTPSLGNRVLNLVDHSCAVAARPVTGRGVSGDAATLDFDDEQAEGRVTDEKIDLAIAVMRLAVLNEVWDAMHGYIVVVEGVA